MTSTELNENSKTSIQQGSKSFSLAAQVFSKELREDVSHLYSWCRWCDDIADGSLLGFHQNPEGLPKNRVDVLLQKSQQAILGKYDGLELPFLAFGEVMRKYQIPWLYAEDLIKGMQQDVCQEIFENFEDLLLYCYRVAGTVGLMMCHIMGLKNSNSLEKAVHLGIALQLTNIGRDIGDDFRVSKVYLPQKWLYEAKIPPSDLLNPDYSLELENLVKKLLKKADLYYKSGLDGLKDLPWRCALAVAIAASVYRTIGKRVIQRGYSSWQTRTSLNKWDQFLASFLGILSFLKTVPYRILYPHRTNRIDKIWEYSFNQIQNGKSLL